MNIRFENSFETEGYAQYPDSSYGYDFSRAITLEELYQAFKERLMTELNLEKKNE